MKNELAQIKATIYQLVCWLVSEDYAAIERFSRGVRLSADLLRQAASEYGRKIIMPPPSAFESIDAILINGSNPQKWSIRFDLWVEGEGRSDLSLECTFIESSNELMIAEIDNLHVL